MSRAHCKRDIAKTVAQTASSSSALLKRLIVTRVRPHRGRIFVACFFMAMAAAATAANAWLMQPALDKIFVDHDRYWLYLVPVAIVAAAVVKGVATYIQSTLMAEVGQRIVAETQVEMHAHLMRADLAWLHQVHTGKLVASFLYDATLLREAVSNSLTDIVKNGLQLIFLAAVMFYQHWQLSLITCVVFPVVMVYSRRLSRKARKGSARSQEETGKLTSILSETFEGARLVKAYGMEARETERTRVSVMERLRHTMKVTRARAASSPATEALGGVAVAIAIMYGGWQAMDGKATLGTFASFITALLMAYQPLKSLANLNTNLQEGLAAADRLFRVLDTEPTIKDAPDARPLAVTGGEIRFEDVSFAYGNEPVLANLDLTVPAGQKVALVGASGAGKSTILNLIPRFYEVSAGRVVIDGQDIRQVTLASLRGAMALVSQESTLFDDSVRGNIAYGRPDATQEQIEAAARAAAAHDFIVALPEGYDTQVGENGLKLSGGQRQRLAIARAMLRDAPILLLDEATSALDAEAERQVQLALRRLMQGRTTLVIAHRLSTVVDADRILVMDKGRVVEAGGHAELLAQGGAYARLYAHQFAEAS